MSFSECYAQKGAPTEFLHRNITANKSVWIGHMLTLRALGIRLWRSGMSLGRSGNEAREVWELG